MPQPAVPSWVRCVQYFPIIAEDYEGTSDRPGCETREDSPHYAEQGRLLHCNTRLRNLTRLDHVVQGALRKCAPLHPLNPDPKPLKLLTKTLTDAHLLARLDHVVRGAQRKCARPPGA